MTLDRVRALLLQSRRLPHLQTKSQRFAWVRARLAYPVPRCAISTKLPAEPPRFARESHIPHEERLTVSAAVRAWREAR